VLNRCRPGRCSARSVPHVHEVIFVRSVSEHVSVIGNSAACNGMYAPEKPKSIVPTTIADTLPFPDASPDPCRQMCHTTGFNELTHPWVAPPPRIIIVHISCCLLATFLTPFSQTVMQQLASQQQLRHPAAHPQDAAAALPDTFLSPVFPQFSTTLSVPVPQHFSACISVTIFCSFTNVAADGCCSTTSC
jgi:hypothetical protein